MILRWYPNVWLSTQYGESGNYGQQKMELFVKRVGTLQQKVLRTKVELENTYHADASWLSDRTKDYKYKWQNMHRLPDQCQENQNDKWNS